MQCMPGSFYTRGSFLSRLSVLKRAKLRQFSISNLPQSYNNHQPVRCTVYYTARSPGPLYIKPNYILRTMGNNSSSDMSSDTYTVDDAPPPEVTFTEEELKSRLTKEQYNVTQEKGTERAFTGEHVNVKDDGTFTCVVCDNVLFKTEKKFESHSGWPSFTDVAEKGNVVKIKDTTLGMVRIEVACRKCGAHLGHVFEDGPKNDTGLRYCINSASLKFKSDSN